MAAVRANYLGRIQDLRSQVLGFGAALPVQAFDWRPIERTDVHGANSWAVLTAHVAGGEHFRLADLIGHRPEARDRPAGVAAVSISAHAVIQLPHEARADDLPAAVMPHEFRPALLVTAFVPKSSRLN